MIHKLDQMFEALQGLPKKRLVATNANDTHTIAGMHLAMQKGLVEGILVGDRNVIMKNCATEKIDPSAFTLIHEPDEMKAPQIAVEVINSGEGDLLMKGLVSSDKYMRAILDKEKGLMENGAILTHVTVMQVPGYHKLLIIGDAAIIPLPELKEKIAIINVLIRTAHSLGIEKPKVAILAATEQVLPRMPACVDAAILSKMADRGQIRGAIVDGPMALDVIVDKESAEIKNMKSEVAGDADCILFPNIEAGNAFYKFNTKLVKGEQGAVVAGARVPAILSSRGDSAMTKLYSIALAAMMAQ